MSYNILLGVVIMTEESWGLTWGGDHTTSYLYGNPQCRDPFHMVVVTAYQYRARQQCRANMERSPKYTCQGHSDARSKKCLALETGMITRSERVVYYKEAYEKVEDKIWRCPYAAPHPIGCSYIISYLSNAL